MKREVFLGMFKSTCLFFHFPKGTSSSGLGQISGTSETGILSSSPTSPKSYVHFHVRTRYGGRIRILSVCVKDMYINAQAHTFEVPYTHTSIFLDASRIINNSTYDSGRWDVGTAYVTKYVCFLRTFPATGRLAGVVGTGLRGEGMGGEQPSSRKRRDPIAGYWTGVVCGRSWMEA